MSVCPCVLLASLAWTLRATFFVRMRRRCAHPSCASRPPPPSPARCWRPTGRRPSPAAARSSRRGRSRAPIWHCRRIAACRSPSGCRGCERCVQLVHAWQLAWPTAEQRSHRRTVQRCDAQSPPRPGHSEVQAADVGNKAGTHIACSVLAAAMPDASGLRPRARSRRDSASARCDAQPPEPASCLAPQARSG